MAESSPRATSQRHSTSLSSVAPTQLSLPTKVEPHEVARESKLGGAMYLCMKVAGYERDKELQSDLDVDKAQLSRWFSDQEGILWPKLKRFMDRCGNHAPVLWMMYDLGYDLHSFRMRESETERALRLAREENAALKRLLIGETR